MDEPRIPTHGNSNQRPSPAYVCGGRFRAVARQHLGPCCATAICDARSPAFRSRSVCCLSDLVDPPRLWRQ
jgi:hypothetical protein